MSALVKTIQTEPLALQLIAASTGVVKSAVIDVSTFFSGTVYWDFSPQDTTASAAATGLSIQSSQKAAGDDAWVPMQEWLSPTVTATILTQNAGGGAGSNVIGVAAGTIGANLRFLLLDGTLANSEFCLRVAQSGANITVEDNLTNSHAANSLITGAERFKIDLDFTGIKRIRICVYNNRGATNRPVYCRVALTTCDSMS
jgi:hypothetical protein